MLYLARVGEFLPNRLTAPLLSTLCTAWPLDEVCAAAVSYFFFGPSSNIRPQDYKGEISRAHKLYNTYLHCCAAQPVPKRGGSLVRHNEGLKCIIPKVQAVAVQQMKAAC